MVFSDTSGLTGIVEDIDFICGTDSTSYPLKDKARNGNRHYYVAVFDILKATGRAGFDDSNLTTIPAETFALVSGQSQYTLPTDLLKIDAIEIADASFNWTRLTEIDKGDLTGTITSFESTSGAPKYYDIIGDQLYLYPAPNYSSGLSNHGKIHYTREVDVFTSTDTTQEPGFAEPFHRIISLGASCDWLKVNSTKEKHDLHLAEYMSLRAELRVFYGEKNKDTRRRFRPIRGTEQYI